MAERTIEIKNVGPIEELSIPIPSGGGVVVLTGANGTGKSAAIAAIGALTGSKHRPPSRDGSLGAQVEGIGVRLTVGRKTTLSGELEILAIDGEDPSKLVDPGLKDGESADLERQRALLRLSGATIEAAEFAALVGGDERLREICRPTSLATKDVPAMTAAIKRDIETAARTAEQEAANLLAKAQGVRATLEEIAGGPIEIQLLCASAAAARQAHTEAVRRHSALEATAKQNQSMLRAGAEARAALDSLGEDGSPAAIAAARAELSELQAEHAQLRAALETIEARSRTAVRALTLQEGAASQRASLARAIEASSGAREIPEEEITALAREVEAAQQESETWAIRERTEGLHDELARITEQGRQKEAEGAELRAAAQGTERILLDAVRRVCGESMELRDGRIYVHSDRGLELFSDLSEGERWRKALDITVSSVGHSGLLTIPQHAWESLDPTNRREIAEHARRLSVVIVTAEAADGEIRAEVA